ncbi:uncharacterized protein LOC110275139 [Arachis duranensis]|uniref:Uncharacterized protein LOC110275139 n=1 Tax=Arachis duranensis TaxID=130453 RepID=A0A6P5MM76_ARADU|nr:uncharacterized protein LOC110275139 [Arachis duranensis]
MAHQNHALNTQTVTYGRLSTSSTSSTSQSALKTRKPSHFRAKIKVQNIQIVVRNLHQNTIKLSVKNLKRKQSNNTQHKMAARNQTKDLKCATYLLSDKFRNMTEEKKAIVRDLGFGGLMHIPPLRVDHQLLRELANNFKLGENRLKTGYGSFQITPKKIGHALGINATEWTPKKESRGKRSQILIQNLNLNQVMRAKNHHLRRRRRKRKKQKQHHKSKHFFG